jgi:hypothetical protein
LSDSPTRPSRVACVCRKVCQEISGSPSASHAGRSWRRRRFFGLSRVWFLVAKTRSSGPVCRERPRCASKASRTGTLIGISRRLLLVLGVPNFPSETVSRTWTPRRTVTFDSIQRDWVAVRSPAWSSHDGEEANQHRQNSRSSGAMPAIVRNCCWGISRASISS